MAEAGREAAGLPVLEAPLAGVVAAESVAVTCGVRAALYAAISAALGTPGVIVITGVSPGGAVGVATGVGPGVAVGLGYGVAVGIGEGETLGDGAGATVGAATGVLTTVGCGCTVWAGAGWMSAGDVPAKRQQKTAVRRNEDGAQQPRTIRDDFTKNFRPEGS